MNKKIILASKSPRRIELLKLIYNDFEFIPSNIDETIPDNIEVQNAAEYLAVQKAKAIALENKDSLVIGCDTVVMSDGEILGKPKSRENAVEMLMKLSGKRHTVISGVCLYKDSMSYSFSDSTDVEFYPIYSAEAIAYTETGEPMDKAGAYGIQGRGALFIRGIIGDYYNVMGLPVARLKREIERFERMIK